MDALELGSHLVGETELPGAIAAGKALGVAGGMVLAVEVLTG